MKQKMKRDNRMGFEMYTTDLQGRRVQRAGNWLAEHTLEILMVALFIAMVYGVGMLMSTTAEAVDLMIEYVDAEQQLQDENYQTQKVLEALVAQRVQERIDANAEQPPYWTVPEETN